MILCCLAFPPATSLALGQKKTANAGMTKAEVIIGKEVIRVDVADTPSLVRWLKIRSSPKARPARGRAGWSCRSRLAVCG